jgi:hypothetical protein
MSIARFLMTIIFLAPALTARQAWAGDLVIQNQTISDARTIDSPEGTVLDHVILAPTANVVAATSFELVLKPGTRIQAGARFVARMKDDDGLPNRCEMSYFGNLLHNPGDDDDGDGLTNLVECQAGKTSPNNPDSDADGILDDCEAPYDATPPTITLIGQNPINLCFGASYTDAGAAARDNCLGDITANIVVTNPVNTNASGTYLITYNVIDGAGNAAVQVTRTVSVDIVRPVLTLRGDQRLTICQGTTYQDPGASASDNCDGDITSSIQADNPVNINQPGNYTVTYNVRDRAGNQANPITRTVVVMGSGNNVQINTTYGYDRIGRITSIRRQAQ